MNEIADLVFALYYGVSDLGHILVRPAWMVTFFAVLLMGTSWLAYFRNRRHPSIFKRYALLLYGCANLLLLPTRSTDFSELARIVSLAFQTGVMIALCMPSGDLDTWWKYITSRLGQEDKQRGHE